MCIDEEYMRMVNRALSDLAFLVNKEVKSLTVMQSADKATLKGDFDINDFFLFEVPKLTRIVVDNNVMVYDGFLRRATVTRVSYNKRDEVLEVHVSLPK